MNVETITVERAQRTGVALVANGAPVDEAWAKGMLARL